MANGGKGAIIAGKQTHILNTWALFATLGLLAWLLLAPGFFADYVKRSVINQHFQLKVTKPSMRVANPKDIHCDVVGIEDRVIVAAEQYHPVAEKAKHIDKKCRSRYEQHCLWKASEYKPSSELRNVLREYEKHHRECVEGHDLQDLVNRGSAPEGSTCQYIVWNDMDGKGNQLISLVSAFVYALLTRRVLLITREAQLQHLLCEPFPFSSWLVPEGVVHARHRAREERHGVFYAQAMNDTIVGNAIQPPRHLVCFLSNRQAPDDLRFFCEGEQKLLKNVPWLFFWSNQYSVPGLYFVPSFRAKLNTWFPDRAVFLHAGRYLLSPRDEIWTRTMRIHAAYLAPADRQLAIQIRAWGSEYKPIITQHILSCAWYSGLLPVAGVTNLTNTSSSSHDSEGEEKKVEDDFSADEAGERISVVLTSLRREYAEGVAEVFAEGRARGHERVTVLSPSSEGAQQFGQISHDRKAISDMWLLSFADQMVSTPKSTFGYVAHGLAGIKPFVLHRYAVDPDKVPDPPCLPSNVPGPCFIDHPKQMTCQLDEPPTDIGDFNFALPEVRHCSLQWGVGVFEDVDELSDATPATSSNTA